MIEAYLDQVQGRRNLENAQWGAASNFQSTCLEQGTKNIQQLKYYQSQQPSYPLGCSYALGRYFLLSLLDIMGQEGLTAALRHFHEGNTDREKPTDDEIYDTFVANTPVESLPEFQILFDELYGEPIEVPDTNALDDHGNGPESATAISAGQLVNGTLEHGLDLDFFRLEATAGQKYQIDVSHDTLSHEKVYVYGPDGQTREPVKSRKAAEFGPRVLWSAPKDGAYYVAMEASFADTGPYTVAAFPVSTPPDDHGDTRWTATPISVGEVIEASLDSFFDYDYFALEVQEGHSYQLTVENLGNGISAVGLVGADGTSIPLQRSEGWGLSGGYIHWTADASGRTYVAVKSPQDSTLDYKLMIDPLSGQ